jgi:glucokinase
VLGDKISLVNHPWAFSTAELRQQLGLGQLRVINDFTAVALAVPKLNPSDFVQIGAGSPVGEKPIGVIGPGTGLGVSGLIPAGGGWIPLQSEGGHVTFSPANARETEVLNLVRCRFDHVSTERLLSGPGLVTLYGTLCELDGVPAAPFSSAEIADPKVGANDARAAEALEMFCAMLGTAAGNLALTLGAQGGIYIAGGIVPDLGANFQRSTFRRSFEGKGRFHDYLSKIPTYIITRQLPALLGAAHLLASVKSPNGRI